MVEPYRDRPTTRLVRVKSGVWCLLFGKTGLEYSSSHPI